MRLHYAYLSPPIACSAAILVALLMLASACSDDDGADARSSGGTVEVVGPAPPGGGGSVSAVGTGCTTKGASTKLPAATVEVQLDEWKVTPPATVAAGVNRVVVKNFGAEDHQLVLARAGSATELPVTGGGVDEAAVESQGIALYRIEAFPANTVCEGTFELAAGPYVLFCNLPASEGSAGASHFEQGMVASVTVQ